MSDVCTWKGCDQPGSVPQVGKDGRRWACLCAAHDAQLLADVQAGVPKAVRAWILAQGGAEAAAKGFR